MSLTTKMAWEYMSTQNPTFQLILSEVTSQRATRTQTDTYLVMLRKIEHITCSKNM